MIAEGRGSAHPPSGSFFWSTLFMSEGSPGTQGRLSRTSRTRGSASHPHPCLDPEALTVLLPPRREPQHSASIARQGGVPVAVSATGHELTHECYRHFPIFTCTSLISPGLAPMDSKIAFHSTLVMS